MKTSDNRGKEPFGKPAPSSITNRPTALRLLLITTVSIFIAEVFVMFLISIYSPLNPYIHSFLDASLLLIFIFPILYFLFYRKIVLYDSEQKRTEASLRESEEKYRSLADSAHDAIISADRNGNIIFWNVGAKTTFGYEADEVIGKPVTIIMPEEYRDAHNKGIERMHSTGESNVIGQTVELYGLRKNGSEFPLELSLSSWETKKGLFYTGIIRDITERKKMQEDKKKLEAKLQRAEKLEAIGTLAGGVAHDLNNVLSGIIGYPQLLLMQLPEDSPLRDSLLAIERSGEKAAAIVQDLLTLARRGVSINEVVNLNNIIREYLESPEYGKMKSYYPDVEIKIDLNPNPLNLFGSPVHLSTIVMNLVSNAAEAMSDEGKISILTENRYVNEPFGSYDHVEEGEYITLKVSDTGTGISSEDMERIFEPFYTKKKMGRSGTGLGLAVVWGIVKDHKGYIDLSSTIGEGTTFVLYFPATRSVTSELQQKLSIRDYAGNGEVIVVVDDVEEQRELTSRFLNEIGYSIITFPSGEEAVAYFKTDSADLLILDMIMYPGMDGLDTYRQIVESYPRQKAIITSGFSETERVKEAQSLGVGQYIRKPYAMEQIGIAVKDELSK